MECVIGFVGKSISVGSDDGDDGVVPLTTVDEDVVLDKDESDTDGDADRELWLFSCSSVDGISIISSERGSRACCVCLVAGIGGGVARDTIDLIDVVISSRDV